MKLTAAQLAQKRKRNRESQRKSRQKTKDQINTLQRQNRELEQHNVSLQERLLHALAAIEVLEKAHYTKEAVTAAPADTYFRSSPNSSAFYHDPSNLVQISPATQMDYGSSTGHSLSVLTPLHDSFDIMGRLDIGSGYESKIESENSWEYSSLHLSPDVTTTADTLFEEFDTRETR